MDVKVTPPLPPTLGLTLAKDTQLLGLGRRGEGGRGRLSHPVGSVPCPKLLPGARPSRHPSGWATLQEAPSQTGSLLWTQILSSLKPTQAPKAPAPGSFPPLTDPPQALPVNHSGWNLMSSGLPAQYRRPRPRPSSWPVGWPHPPRGSSQQCPAPTRVHHGLERLSVAGIGWGWSEISWDQGLDPFCMIRSMKVCVCVHVHVCACVCVHASHACAA